MDDKTVLIQRTPHAWTLTLNRPAARNAVNQALMQALQQAFVEAETDPNCRLIILQGQAGFFCTGMDFQEAAQEKAMGEMLAGQGYMAMINRISTSAKIVVAKVEGTVLAGGMGLVAASDVVIATPESRFGLPEALWGLLPACVIPYLIRRVGFQHAYRLTLTTENILAEEAARIGLVDTVSDKPDDAIRRLLLRVGRLTDETILEAKGYFRKMWLITSEMEQTAVQQLNHLISKPQVQENIKNYVEYQKFPWET